MTIFNEPDFPTQFRAIGLIKGIYSSTSKFKGVLTLENGTAVKAILGGKLKVKRSNQPDWLSNVTDGERAWKVYPKTDGTGKLEELQLNSCHTRESEHWNQVDRVVVRGLVVSEIEKENNSNLLIVEIQPNPQSTRKNHLAFKMVITGESLPTTKEGEFWEFVADVVDGQLIYHSGECIEKEYDPNKTYAPPQKVRASGDKNDRLSTLDENGNSETIQMRSSQSSEVSTIKKIKETLPQASPNNSQPVASEIVMIPGRAPELTVKFNTRPELPETGKKVTLQVNGENGINVRATLNRKTLKKQVDKMDSFDEWVGALSGQMVAIADDGVIEARRCRSPSI